MISFCNGGSSQLTHWEESRANSMPYYFRDSTGNLLTYYVFTSENSYLIQGGNSHIVMLQSLRCSSSSLLYILQRCYWCYFCPCLVQYQVKIVHQVSKP